VGEDLLLDKFESTASANAVNVLNAQTAKPLTAGRLHAINLRENEHRHGGLPPQVGLRLAGQELTRRLLRSCTRA
jgi:hypothetical protein